MEALDVAKYILQESNKRLSNLELQKTLYFATLDFYRKHKKLLVDEFEAWQYGPVSRKVYYEYRHYGASSIERPIGVDLELSEEEKKTLKASIENCNKKTYWDLVQASHKEGGAWYKAYDEKVKNHIPIEDIKKEAKNIGNM